MHFSKAYSQLLLELPPELRENAIQYRQLKKIINQVVQELSSVGLSPDVLQKFIEARHTILPEDIDNHTIPNGISTTSAWGDEASTTTFDDEQSVGSCFPKVYYEFSEDEESSKIIPRLRISLESPGELGNLLHGVNKVHLEESQSHEGSEGDGDGDDESSVGVDSNGDVVPVGASLLWKRQQGITAKLSSSSSDAESSHYQHEVVIPLESDGHFFDVLHTALEAMSGHLKVVQKDFTQTLQALSRTIAGSARPASSSHSLLGGFHPNSPLIDHAGAIQVRQPNMSKSDLYSWREIFQLYMEAEVFESIHEHDRGERNIEESERRLQLFAQQLTQRGLAGSGKLKLKQSRAALETFLQMNMFILNIKKFQLANSEATRKILKKHTKRTALPLFGASSDSTISIENAPSQLAIIPRANSISLPHIFVQAIAETLLPIIPHLDDYSCLICTSIAFKPIRLDCGHLFCVRCLVKMQKRGNSECPMCRSPSVLIAGRANVDWALMNFMQDWFPIEARGKLKADEKEAIAEDLRNHGLDPDTACVVM